MDKKRYIAPSITVTGIKTESLICASLGHGDGPNGLWNEESIESVSGRYADVKGSGSSIWDDDWN